MVMTSKSVEQEVHQLQESYQMLKGDVDSLKASEQVQDNEIAHLKDGLENIQDDTTWIRRKITGAFITSFATAFVGGTVGVIASNLIAF